MVLDAGSDGSHSCTSLVLLFISFMNLKSSFFLPTTDQTFSYLPPEQTFWFR